MLVGGVNVVPLGYDSFAIGGPRSTGPRGIDAERRRVPARAGASHRAAAGVAVVRGNTGVMRIGGTVAAGTLGTAVLVRCRTVCIDRQRGGVRERPGHQLPQ